MFSYKVFSPYELRHQFNKDQLITLMDSSFVEYSETRELIGQVKNFWSEYKANESLNWTEKPWYVTLVQGIQNEMFNTTKIIDLFETYSDLLYDKMVNVQEMRQAILVNLGELTLDA